MAESTRELLEALQGCIYPNVPSADEMMLMFMMGGVTGDQIEGFRPTVDKARKAQDHARKVIKKYSQST